MARYRDSVCKLCRRENMKLMLKGEHCYTDKCSIDRRPYPPGQHGQKRAKYTDYGLQLREKQKVKRFYGLLERQFRNYYLKANKMKGMTGHNLLQLLERRLDNVVYRLGFASTRNEARQFVSHGHFFVNGRKVNIPSFLVKEGMLIELREKAKNIIKINESLEVVERRGIPAWLELDRNAFRGVVKSLPSREDITTPIQEQLVVELYSK